MAKIETDLSINKYSGLRKSLEASQIDGSMKVSHILPY